MGTLKNMSVTDLIRAGIVTVTREDIDYLRELVSVYEEDQICEAATMWEAAMDRESVVCEDLIETVKAIVALKTRRVLSNSEYQWIGWTLINLDGKGA